MAEQNNNNDFLAEYRRRQQERWAQEQKSQANAPPAEQQPQLMQEEINLADPQQAEPHQEQYSESLDELRQNFADRFRATVQEEDNDPILVEDDAELNEVDKFWSDEQVKIQQEKADEEYARKLQEEFDAEMAEAVQQAEIQQGEAPQQNNRPPLQEPFVDRLVNDENDYIYQQQEVPIVHDNRRAARVSQQQEGFVNMNQQQQFAQQYTAATNQGNNNDDVIIVQHHNRARRPPVQQQVSNQNPYMFVQQQQQQAAAPQQQGNSYQVYEQVTQTYNQNGEPIRIKRIVTNHNGNVTSQEFIEPLSVNTQQYSAFQRYPFVQQQQSRVSFVPQQQFVQQQQQILNNGSNSFAGNDDFFNGFEPMSRSMQRMAQTMQASRRRFSSMFNM